MSTKQTMHQKCFITLILQSVGTGLELQLPRPTPLCLFFQACNTSALPVGDRRGSYLVFGCHGDGVVLASGGMSQTLASGHRGVSHGRRGEQDPQVLDRTPQAFSLHLAGSARESQVTLAGVWCFPVKEHVAQVERDHTG